MKQNPLLSVVMSCYNSEMFVAKTIESVLKQSFSDFEFIIVDDGSTDKTKDIINSFLDDRIRYFYQVNSGVGNALAKGCKCAIGKYIARIDSDDICVEDRFFQQINFLNAHSDYVLVGSGVLYIDQCDNVIGAGFPYIWDWSIRRLLMINNPIAQPTVMFRKCIYEKTGGYIPLLCSEDYYLWNRMKQFGKMKNLPVPLVRYRIQGNSLSNIYLDKSVVNKVVLEVSEKEFLVSGDIEKINSMFIEIRKKGSIVVDNQIYSKKPLYKLYVALSSIFGKKQSYWLTTWGKQILCSFLFFIK